eukprot:14323252-Alexandrium_andersonii.AAC.1
MGLRARTARERPQLLAEHRVPPEAEHRAEGRPPRASSRAAPRALFAFAGGLSRQDSVAQNPMGRRLLRRPVGGQPRVLSLGSGGRGGGGADAPP